MWVIYNGVNFPELRGQIGKCIDDTGDRVIKVDFPFEGEYIIDVIDLVVINEGVPHG